MTDELAIMIVAAAVGCMKALELVRTACEWLVDEA